MTPAPRKPMPVRIPWMIRLAASESFVLSPNGSASITTMAHQAKRLQSNRFAVQIAVKTDQAARQRGDAKTQHNLGPVKQSDVLLFKVRTAYFGTRPII